MIKAIVLLGPPGAGKGTQARSLAYALNKAHVVGMGDLLRKEIADKTSVGMLIKSSLESGQLLHDPKLVMDVLRAGLADVDGEYVILDGVPRDIEQALLVQQVLAEVDVQIVQVLLLEVPSQLAKNRIATRYQCTSCGAGLGKIGVCPQCGGPVERRHDDTEDIIEERLKVYNDTVEELVDYYKRQDLLTIVDATQAASRITQEIVTRLNAL